MILKYIDSSKSPELKMFPNIYVFIGELIFNISFKKKKKTCPFEINLVSSHGLFRKQIYKLYHHTVHILHSILGQSVQECFKIITENGIEL